MTDSTPRPTEDELRRRAEAGAAWLDKVLPDWPLKIDIGKLDMSEACSCVLGQLALTITVPEGKTSETHELLGPNFWSWTKHVFDQPHVLSEQQVIDYGFNVEFITNSNVDFIFGPWKLLEDIWAELIKARLDDEVEAPK